ncbi:hypothetical protein QTP86_008181 [Hemibagrus guttatus]|nr:hypothetical protein QTP86_008181 [Hemibagrus guttatus]
MKDTEHKFANYATVFSCPRDVVNCIPWGFPTVGVHKFGIFGTKNWSCALLLLGYTPRSNVPGSPSKFEGFLQRDKMKNISRCFGGNFFCSICGLPNLCHMTLFAAKTALTREGMDSTRSLKVCCGIWHQDVSSRSFKSWVATANHLSPPIPIFCILNTCTH